MANITDLRNGIAANLKTIPGLRVASTIPDQINPPQAVVSLDKIDYQRAFHRGLTEYTFKITVIVSRQSERNAQQNLDAYVASTGKYSVLEAMETDRTLGGSAFDLTLIGMDTYGSVSIGEVNYLSADFSVRVLAS